MTDNEVYWTTTKTTRSKQTPCCGKVDLAQDSSSQYLFREYGESFVLLHKRSHNNPMELFSIIKEAINRVDASAISIHVPKRYYFKLLEQALHFSCR